MEIQIYLTTLILICVASCIIGYRVASGSSRVPSRYKELFKVQDEYIKLLGEENNELSAFANGHGWVSKRAEKGKVLRERIQELKK